MWVGSVLITGGAGFIGSHLCDRLIQCGCDVIVIDNESTGWRGNVNPKAKYIHGDILNPADLDSAFDGDVDIVFHLAAQVSNIKSYKDPIYDLAVNTQGTLNVLEKCLERRIPRLLYASSMHVYGQPTQIPTPETAPCNPLSYYGITKYAAERFVHRTAERGDLDFVFNVTSFRMFNVYGPRQSLDNPYQGVVGVFIGNLIRNEPLTLYGSGQQSRDFIYIDDVIEAWLATINASETYGHVFNLGTGKDMTILKLIEALLEMNKQSHGYPIIRRPPLEGDQEHICADIQETHRCLKWSPKVDILEGIRRTLAWATSSFENK
jgi:UDP-glucose 4-epimerase